MVKLRRMVVVAVLGGTSVGLLACAGGPGEIGGEADETTFDRAAVVAEPLVERCSGTYACTSADGARTLRITLEKEVTAFETCWAGTTIFQDDQDVTTDAGGHRKVATWSGDSNAFDVCTEEEGCLHCVDVALSGSEDAAVVGPSCSGEPSCSDFDVGECNRRGCYWSSRVAYRDGKNQTVSECLSSGEPLRPCSSNWTEAECRREGCTWN